MSESAWLQAFINGLMDGALYSLLAIGLTLVFGIIKIINVSHGELMVIGAYISYFAFTLYGVDPLLSIFLSMVIGLLVGICIQYLLVRWIAQHEMLTLLVTFGVSGIIMNSILIYAGADIRRVWSTYGAIFFNIFGLRISFLRILLLSTSLIIAISLYLLLYKTDIGKAIRAYGQNREAAMLFGVNGERIEVLVFGLSGALASLAGALYVQIGVISPVIGGQFTTKAFLVTVLGGVGSVLGALIGGLSIGLLENILTFTIVPSALKGALGLVLLIVVLLIRSFKKE